MHIGIDLDNTILDATSSHLYYYNKASGKNYSPADVNDFYLYRLYGWDEAEREKIFHEYGHLIHWHSEPYPYAIEKVNQLYQSHQITIITARPEHFRDVTIKWLDHHKVSYHQVIFTENKYQQCVNLEVDVLVDDAPHYAMEFSANKRPVILVDQPYNIAINNELVYRANNWIDVYREIENLNAALL